MRQMTGAKPRSSVTHMTAMTAKSDSKTVMMRAALPISFRVLILNSSPIEKAIKPRAHWVMTLSVPRVSEPTRLKTQGPIKTPAMR